jgi:CRP-like cAMP-binding protein
VGVASLLVLLAERNGVPEGDLTVLPGRLTQQTMAEMLGVRRETVTGALRQLRSTGAVRKTLGRYMVNTGALEELTGT